jgi:Tol biopolymer transport system component
MDDKIALYVIRSGNIFTLKPHTYYHYVVRADGKGEISNSLPSGLGDNPKWSSDGQWVLFSVVYREGTSPGGPAEIYLMRVDGSKKTKVVDYRRRDSRIDDAHTTWSPDSKQIAFVSNGIHILNVECYLQGEKCQPQPSFLAVGDDPDWSPDGNRIAYYSKEKGGIWIANPDGTQSRNLISDVRCIPKWSPDGGKIALGCNNDTSANIFVINTDGSGIKQLTNNGNSWKPQWSPDGKKIAFIQSLQSKECVDALCAFYPSALFLMNADGSDIIRISLLSDENIVSYTWLPAKK